MWWSGNIFMRVGYSESVLEYSFISIASRSLLLVSLNFVYFLLRSSHAFCLQSGHAGGARPVGLQSPGYSNLRLCTLHVYVSVLPISLSFAGYWCGFISQCKGSSPFFLNIALSSPSYHSISK